MRATKQFGWTRFAVVCAIAFASAVAFGQTPANILVACQGTGTCPAGGHSSPYTDLQEAIDDAVADAITLNQQVLLLVIGGPWVGPYTIPADANVHILGQSFNTQQTITLVDPNSAGLGDTFTLSFTDPATSTTDTTGDLDFDATAAEVQTALEGLTTIGAGNVTVSGPDGGPYTVNFIGALASTPVPLIVPDDTLLTPVEAFVLVVSNEGPFSTIIQGNGVAAGAAFTITGATTEDRDAGVGRDRLIIEGLTFTDGSQGIRIDGGTAFTPAIQPILNRLYIRGNGDGSGTDDAGVLVEGVADPLLVNCSISDNIGDGVRVDGIATDLTDVDILHCSIIRNSNNGVFVAAGNDARVRNTLVYLNGTGTGEGGLVWEDNPFIDPDTGPLDGLIAGIGSPIQVTINGANFDQGGPTQVFFGPPAAAPATIANVNTQTDTQLIVDLPPAYNGIPGQVDVTIRRSDGFEIVVPNGFTYTAELNGGDPVPVIWQVDPGWGPTNASDVDVYVLGAFFDRDCSVFFDLDDDDILEVNEISPRVQWLSSGRLFVRVPANATAGRVDVWVRNNATGEVTLLGPIEEYEYRAGFTNPGPEIFSIVPNTIDTTAGSAGSTNSDLLPDIFGTNFQAGAIVKIGGIVCPYTTFATNRLGDINVPVSEFGGGGVYDVEVVNPDGLSDILPRAFTYFPMSTPGLDALPWRVSNFVERGTGGARSILGHGFDFQVDLIATAGPSTFLNDFTPIAQRQIPFTYPADTDGLGLGSGLFEVNIDVMNASTASGSASTTPVDSTILVYAEPRATQTAPAGGAVFFEINSVTITTVGATDTIELDIENYRNQYEIWVGEVQVQAADITLVQGPLGPPFNGIISFPAPTQPEGVFGPVDIRVVSPTGTGENLTSGALYTIAEDAYSYRRAGVGEFPQVSAVTPNTVADTGTGPVQITGQNFIGPVGIGVFTRVLLDPDGTYEFGTAAQDEIDLSAAATGYSVDSISQISFTDFDLSAIDPGPVFAIPRDTPLDLVVEQFDAINGVVLTDGTNPLRSRLIGAITFQNAVAPPTITNVTPATGPVSGDENAPGGFQVTITGTNFGATLTPPPIVLFGSSQAEVDVAASTAGTILVVDLPPAPNGLPGIYDVTVIRVADQVEATDVDAFTYYMDGAPIITQVSPNHVSFDPADPTATESPIFITIYGYNFDDDLRVTFGDDITLATDTVELDTTNNPDRVRVISPTEVVVQLTTADLVILLQAIDYTTNVADMSITVQNKASLYPTSDLVNAPSLTSAPPTPFFAYDDARGDVTIIMPELLYNDVYENNQDDYVNVSPGTGSISVNPVVLLTPWIGKLLPDPITHPLLSTAGPFTEDPYTLTDFELEARPQGGGAEIGADEIGDLTLDVCSWYLARITPNPVGVTPARQLTIELQYSGNCGGVPFIVPQGGDPRVVADRIPLDLYQNPGAGYFIYTNRDAITTVLEDRDANSRPTVGDLIADGHATVYMERGTNIIGFDDTSGLGDLIEGGVIIGQAIAGRHFLIDTVPPRIYLEVTGPYGGAITVANIVAGEVVIDTNDLITALDHNALTHPNGAPPDTLPYRPSIVPPPTWVSDDGGIYFSGLDGVNTIPQGLQVFMNRGSEANPDTNFTPFETVSVGATLDMTIEIQFIDPPVTDPTDPLQLAIPGLDIFTNETNRQVAGFPILAASTDDLVEAAGGAAIDNILFQGSGRWFADPTIALTNGFAKTAQFVTGSTTTNIGVFDPTLVPGDSVPSPSTADIAPNDLLTATWVLTGLAPSPSQTWRLRAQFVGEDLSFNATTNNTSTATPQYYATLFDPLQFWWMYDVASSLTGPSTCEAAPAPFFNVGLIGQRPSHTGEPFAAFTYKLYVSAACDGPYFDSGIPWSNWTTSTLIDLLSDLSPAEEAALNNQYVMIVSLGADEAGNVEPLRFDPLTVDPSALPPNARTFLFTNQQPADTAVGLELWYDLIPNGIIDGGEPVFGDNPIVPYDPSLRARYAVSVNSLGTAAGPFNVSWAFHEDGIQTISTSMIPPAAEIGPFTSNSDVIARVAPAHVTSPGAPDITPLQNNGALGNPRAAVTYLFTAAAYYMDNGIPIVDPSPASAYFVVVPAGVGDYVLSPEDGNKQPIKEQGRE